MKPKNLLGGVAVAVATAAVLLVSGAAAAHPSKAVKRNHKQCKTLAKKKKIAACKACVTRYKGKRHYHPHAKKGRRCHPNGAK